MSDQPRPAVDERRAVPSLRVGFVPGVTLTKWRRIWAERFPRLSLEVVELTEAEQRAALVDERVDLSFVRLPVDERALHVIPLYEEQAVVVTPKDHPVAVFDAVSLTDLSEEDVVQGFEVGEALDLVAGGAGVLYLPQSVARSSSRRDLVHRPVSDGVPTRIALAWLRENPHEMIEEFIGIVRGRTVNSTRGTAAPTPPAPKTPVRKPPAKKAVQRQPGRTRGSGGTSGGGRRRG